MTNLSAEINDIKYSVGNNSFLDAIGSFIGNNDFTNGLDYAKANKTTKNSFIYQALSAIGSDVGDKIFQNVMNYVDYVSNIDLCKIKTLQSTLKSYGITYQVLEQLNTIPIEIGELIDILSVNKKYFLQNIKFNGKLIDNLKKHSVIITDSNGHNYIEDPKKYKEYITEIFKNIISSYVTLSYLDDENTRIIDTTEFYDEYTSNVSDRWLSTEILYNIDRSSFNVYNIVDNIERGLDSLSAYSGGKLKLIECEIQYRNKCPDYINTKYNNIQPRTKFAYYRRLKVLEYVQFVENKYYYDNIPNILSISPYEINENYFKIADNFTQLLTYQKDNNNNIISVSVNNDMIEYTAENITDIVLYIAEIREKIKIQTRKNYMKGTYNLIQFMINEYLIEYSRMNENMLSQYGLSTVYQYLKSHSIDDVELVEYYDSTEYFNLKTDNSDLAVTSGNVNNKFWIDNYEDVSQDIEKAFSDNDISNYYINTISFDNKIKTADELSNFLSTVFNLGAHDSFVNENNIFHCQLSDKQYTYNLYPHLVGLSSNYTEFNKYILSTGEFEYPVDILANQISSVMEHIYTWLSDVYITDISSISVECQPKIDELSIEYNSMLELFNNTISSDQYGVYFKMSNNRFCYKDNDADFIDTQNWKIEYSDHFFIDGFLPEPYWQDQSYNKYLLERINKLNQFVNEKSYIINYPLSTQVDYLYIELSDLIEQLYDEVVDNIVLQDKYSDPMYPLLKSECDDIIEFLNKKIDDKKTQLNNTLTGVINSAQAAANVLNAEFAALLAQAQAITMGENPAPDIKMGKIPQYYYRTEKITEDKDIDGTYVIAGKYTSSDKLKQFDIDKEPDNYAKPDIWYSSHKTGNIEAGYQRYIYDWIGDEPTGGNTKYYEKLDLYDKSNYLASIQVPELPDGIDSGQSLEVLDSDSVEISIKKYLAWIIQITRADGKTYKDEDDNTIFELTSCIQGFYNSATESELKSLLSKLESKETELSDAYNELLNNINNLNEYGFSDPPSFSDKIDVAIQEILKYLQDCITEIPSIIDSDEDIARWSEYLTITKQVASENDNLVQQYNQIQSDQEQTLYLANYAWQSNFTLNNLNTLKRYIKTTDNTNNTVLKEFIRDIYNKYDILMYKYYDVSDFANSLMRETSYKYEITYIEIGFETLINAIMLEMQLRLQRAVEEINKQKTIVDSYMYNNDYSIQYEINEKYGLLSSTENLVSAVYNRLSDLNFFEFDYYKEQLDFYNTYAYGLSSYDPYYVYKNTTHPSYQVHPYLHNFIESRVIDQFVLQSFDNGLIEELEESVIENNISNFIGDCGQTINTWFNDARDYSGYKSRYEASHNQIDIYNKTQILPIVDYDGAFFPPAVEQLRLDYDNCVNQVLVGNLSDDTSFYKKYYEHLELDENQRLYIANQLSVYKDLILNITYPRMNYTDEGGVYDIYKYTIDQYNTSYILYKRYNDENISYEDKLNTPGQLWTRLENHPIAFPAFYGEYPNFELSSIYANTIIIHELTDSDDGAVTDDTKMTYFYDMQFDDSSQLLALIAVNKNAETESFKNANVYFGHIGQYETIDGRPYMVFADNGITQTGKAITYVSMLETEPDYNLIGYAQSDRNTLTFIYVNVSSTYISVKFKTRIKNYENSQFINGNNFSKTCTLFPKSGYNFYNNSNIIVSFDKINNIYSIAALIQKIDNNALLSVMTPNYSLSPNYPDATVNPDNEYNSFDSLPFIMIFKYNDYLEEVKNDIIINLNADSSYDPLYPGELGAVQKNASNQYVNIELLGCSKNIDNEISSINKDVDPYFDINKIINNYTFGRVYENYTKLDDKSILVSYNDLLVKKAKDKNYPVWTIDVSELNDNIYNIIFFNTFTYGKNPYYIGDTRELSSGWVDCYYMYNIDNNAEVKIFNDNNVTFAGTYNYFNGKQNLLDSNKIHNVKNIKIQYNSESRHIQIYFEVDDLTKDSYIAKNSLQVIIVNQYDLQIFKYYHLLDAFGIINTRYITDDNLNIHIPVPNSSYYDKNVQYKYISFYDNNSFIQSNKYNITDTEIKLPSRVGYYYVLPPGIDFSQKKNIKVYGHFNIKSYNVTVKYWLENKQQTLIKNVNYGTNFSRYLPTNNKTGYKFKNWNIDRSRIDFIGYNDIPNGTNITISAIYTPITYTIKFNDGKSICYTMSDCHYDNPYTIPSNIKTQHSDYLNFKYWKNYNGQIYNTGQIIKNITTVDNAVIELTAEYEYNTEKASQLMIFDTDKSLGVEFQLSNNYNALIYTGE